MARRAPSLNAMKHGLSDQTIVSPKERSPRICRFARSYFHELKPKGVIEMQLVQNLADGSWRLNRDCGFETTLLTLGFDEQAITSSSMIRKSTVRSRPPRLIEVKPNPSRPLAC